MGGEATWLSTDELVADLQEHDYRVRLNGAVSVLVEDWQTQTPTPTHDPAVASTGWTAASYGTDWERRPGEGPLMLVRDGSGRPEYIVSNAGGAVWASDGSGFTFSGNTCAGYDHMWFDTVTGEVTSLTATDESVWSRLDGPGPTEVSLGILRHRQGAVWTVDVLNSDALQRRALLTVPAGGGLRLIAWSPDKSRLLVQYTGGGKSRLCEATPTAVERIP